MKSYIASKIYGLTGVESGALLVETVVAVMVFTAVGTAVLTGLSTSQTSSGKTERQSIAENIARNQMEYVASLPYQPPPHTYPSVGVPAGYSVTAQAIEDVPGDTNIEKVVVTINFEGQVILSLETFRTNIIF